MNNKTLPTTLTIVILALIVILFYFFILPGSEITDSDSEIKWSKTLGGSENEEGYYVLSTGDGCIVLGYTESYENQGLDIYLIKINENGAVEWEKNYGGIGDDYGKAIIQVDDGYIIVGTSNSTGVTSFDYNALLIKIDHSGIVLWNKTYGGVYEDSANSILETESEDYIITGSTYSIISRDMDLWVFKINKTGNVTMNKIFEGDGFDEGRCIIETNDGFLIAGEVNSYSKNEDYSDAWIFKINKTGHHMWNKTFDGFGYNDLFNQIISTNDGFIAVGHTQNITKNGLYDEYYSNGFIVITDENGEILSQRILEEDEETGISSVEKADDGYIVIGYIGPYGTGEGNITVEKIDNLGNRIWLKTYGGDYSDAGVWIDRETGNNYFVTGYQDVQGNGLKDLWIAKLELK